MWKCWPADTNPKRQRGRAVGKYKGVDPTRLTDRVGAMTSRIAIQENQSLSKTGFGQEVENWVTIGNTWAEITPVTGREQLEGVAVRADTTHKLRFWFRKDLKRLSADMRATQGTRIFQFAEPPRNLSENDYWYEVMAIELVTNPVGT